MRRAPLVSFSCFTYCWVLVSFFFKGPKWNLPDRAGFEDWFVVTVFPLPISFSEHHTYFVVEKQISAHLLRVKVLHTPSRVAERFPRLGSGRACDSLLPLPLRVLTRSDLFPPSPSSSWNVRSVFSNGSGLPRNLLQDILFWKLQCVIPLYLAFL